MSCDYDGQILDPFFSFFAVGRFQNQRLVRGCKYFEASWDVPHARHLDGSNLIDVDGCISALFQLRLLYIRPTKYNIKCRLTDPLHERCPADSVKYLVRHRLKSLHFPFFSLSCPSITGCVLFSKKTAFSGWLHLQIYPFENSSKQIV